MERREFLRSSAGGLAVLGASAIVTGLVPSGTRPLTGQSPESVVEWMTYESRGAPVELAKLEGSGSQYLATVKATGIWDANQQPLVKQYALPNQAAPTDN